MDLGEGPKENDTESGTLSLGQGSKERRQLMMKLPQKPLWNQERMGMGRERRGEEEVGRPQAGSLPRAEVSLVNSRLLQDGREEGGVQGKEEGRGVSVGDGAKSYRLGRVWQLKGHFGSIMC